MEDKAKPKFNIGDTVEASWNGGHTSTHVITGRTRSHHGYWYTWETVNMAMVYMKSIFVKSMERQ